jgi:hypothetical protein
VRPHLALHSALNFPLRINFIGSDSMIHEQHPSHASTTRMLYFQPLSRH